MVFGKMKEDLKKNLEQVKKDAFVKMESLVSEKEEKEMDALIAEAQKL